MVQRVTERFRSISLMIAFVSTFLLSGSPPLRSHRFHIEVFGGDYTSAAGRASPGSRHEQLAFGAGDSEEGAEMWEADQDERRKAATRAARMLR